MNAADGLPESAEVRASDINADAAKKEAPTNLSNGCSSASDSKEQITEQDLSTLLNIAKDPSSPKGRLVTTPRPIPLWEHEVSEVV